MISREDRREAENSVERLIYQYSHRLDGADFDAFASMFDNATWRISPQQTCTGRQEVRAWLEENLTVHGDRLGTRHIISNILTDVAEDGLSARSVSYGVVTQVTDRFPLQVISQAQYEDAFAKTDGRWHFVDRRVLLDGYGDLSAHQRFGWPSPGDESETE